MRRLTFVLMIALLLLRGWMGEAMATGMALTPLPHQGATQNIATHTHEKSAQAHFDHGIAEHESFHVAQAMHECAGDRDGEDASHAQCDTCAACQACNTVALTPPALSAHPVFSAGALPRHPAAFFASADAARGHKPPIS